MPVTNHPVVGRVWYEVLSGGRLKMLTPQNLATAFIPELKGVPTYGNGKFSGNVLFYASAIPQLKAAFHVIGKLGLADKVIFWSGSYVPRLKRGGSTPSNHSFGTAFDINHQQNPFRRPIAPKGAYGSVVELLPVFRALGFECGADWKNTPDGMHFEIERIMSQAEIDAAVAKLLGQSVARPVTGNPVTAPMPRKLALFDGKAVRDVEGARIIEGRNFAAATEFAEALGFETVTDTERTTPERLVLKVYKPIG